MKPQTRLILKVVFWLLSVGIVLVTGIIYFPLEVEGITFWGALYYSIRLFILEHDIPNFPTRTPLICIYFFAPIVALSALGTVISYLYRFSPAWIFRLKKDHTIICGVGRVGKLVYTTLKEHNVSIVGVDRDTPDNFSDFISKNKAHIIFGDFLSITTLTRAGINKAANIVFASSDDLLNLEGAIGIFNKLTQKEHSYPLTIWVHIANDRLLQTTKTALQSSGTIKIRFFDTFSIAALKTVEKHFTRSQRKGIDKITILGFGEFGHDLIKALIEDAGQHEKWDIDVVDLHDRHKEVFNLAEKLNISDRITFTKADILDYELDQSSTRAVFLCTDDDIRNLSTALLLTQANNNAYFYIRMAMWPLSAVKEHLGNGNRLRFININALVSEGISDIKDRFM